MPATILPKFKSTQLKQLAFLCGVKSSGRKSELVERLATVANSRPTEPSSKQGQLILSVDLGIRNLGYSLLSPAAPLLAPGHLSSADDLRRPPRIHLHAWQRRELVEQSADGRNDPEQFSPASLAIATDRLVRRDLLPLKPTHLLIERQRWRSGGAAAIQEWTLRVNTLEAMLHASLRTLRELGHWNGEIMSVPPDRVTRFWPSPPLASGEAAPKTRTRRPAKAVVAKVGKEAKSQQNSKKHKIGVLANWLLQKDGNEVVLPANRDTEDAIKHFRTRLAGVRRSRLTDDLVRDVGPRKLDDLTDSLLQGVAWLKWEENKESLLGEEGLTKLLHSNFLDEQETSTMVDDDV
ncbi:Ydc2-catalyt-domain-containing protein [Hypoxylon crocopeplum]|nr:Ydc2-catalyt-domain-containing protein [Hypoxylon crocopeplum]